MKRKIFTMMPLAVLILPIVFSLVLSPFMVQGQAGGIDELDNFTGPLPVATIDEGTFSNLFRDVISYLWIIILGIAVIMMLVGAIMWMTSGGDATKTKTARMLIIYALMGVARTALEWVADLMGAGGGTATGPTSTQPPQR